MEKNNKSKKIIVSLALILSFSAFDKAVAQEWQPNSIEKIEASIREDNKKYNEKEYDIRWGDYLYGISQATKVDIDTLAQINSIANKNLIIAGNKLYYGTNSNIVTKDSDGNTRVFQEQRYDGTKKVEEAPKDKLTGKEEKQIVEDNPSLAKDFNSKNKIDNKIVKENKEQIKELDKDIKDLKKDKKELQKQKDKLIRDGEEKNKDKIAEIDKKIKETDKKIDSKEKQKDYLQTENDKIEAEQKGDKDKADEKQKELEDKKDNDPYEIWKKEQKEKNPNLKDEDLTKEQYEIWKKNKDKKPDVKPENPSEPEKPKDPEKPGKDDPKDPEEKPEDKPNPDKPGKDDKEDPKKPDEKPDEKPNPDEPKKPENPKDPEDKPKKPEQPTEPEKPEDEVVVKEVYEEVPFNTVRAINDPNLKTRVSQKGVNGKDLYKVTYKNGEFVKKDFVKTVTEPVDEIIQSYVKVKDAEYETRYKERFFASGITSEDYENMPAKDYNNINDPAVAAKYIKTYYFDTYEEAATYMKNFDTGNFGSADPVEETVKVADEVWEWQ
jgi:hypothetical protein